MLRNYLFLFTMIAVAAVVALGQGTNVAEKGKADSWAHIVVTVGNVADFKTEDREGWRNNGTGFSAIAAGSGQVPIKIDLTGLAGVSYFDYKAAVTVKTGDGSVLLTDQPVISKDGGSKSYSVVWDPAAKPGGVSVSVSIMGGNPEHFTYYVSGSISPGQIPAGAATPKPTPTPKPETKVTVIKFGEDFKHHPLEFEISVTRDNKPLAGAPVTFDVTGGYKALNDNFLVFDRQSNQWNPVGRDKIYGITSANALRTGPDGKISIHFLADFERMRLLNVSFPFYITLTAVCKPDGAEAEVSGSANIVAKHVAYARAVYFQLGSITYREMVNPLTDKLTRRKVVERGSWSNIVTEYDGSSRDIYDRITMNGKPFEPPNEDAEYWLPLVDDALLRMDYTPRGPLMPNLQRTSWLPPLASGMALEIEWIDGTQGQFSLHNDDNSDQAIIAMRIPNSAGKIQGSTGERLAYFAMAQADEAVVEFVAKRALLATFTTPAGAAAVEVGWFLYEIWDNTMDAAGFLKALTQDELNLGGGGTFVRLKSKVAQYPNPDGGTTLYTFEGSPSVYDQNGRAVTARAGQAIDFKVGGAVSPAVRREPPAFALADLRLLERPRSVPTANPVVADGTFLSTIPSVGGTVTSFRFFTGDGDTPPPQGVRTYLTRFPKATAKTIYYELTIKYATDNASTFTMSATWTLNRQPFARQDLALTRPRDWNISTRSYGLYKEPGKWEAGTYTVEIEVEGRKVAAGSFVVY